MNYDQFKRIKPRCSSLLNGFKQNLNATLLAAGSTGVGQKLMVVTSSRTTGPYYSYHCACSSRAEVKSREVVF